MQEQFMTAEQISWALPNGLSDGEDAISDVIALCASVGLGPDHWANPERYGAVPFPTDDGHIEIGFPELDNADWPYDVNQLVALMREAAHRLAEVAALEALTQ